MYLKYLTSDRDARKNCEIFINKICENINMFFISFSFSFVVKNL